MMRLSSARLRVWDEVGWCRVVDSKVHAAPLKSEEIIKSNSCLHFVMLIDRVAIEKWERQ